MEVMFITPNLELKYFCSTLLVFIIHSLISGTHANICTSKDTCATCIRENPLCAWCAQENFTDTVISRCNIMQNLENKCDDIVFLQESLHFIKNEKLSAKKDEAIQIKPQEIKLRIRPNSVRKLDVKFRQAVDYPVDLYFLMDLSFTMLDDKEKLADLGNKLADEMGSITRDFKLGFGSFVDKTVAPFIEDHPDLKKQPCKLKKPPARCYPAYGFHNDMPLSSNTGEFAKKVRAVLISANLDIPEGGLDAVMQAVVCVKEIGWRNHSRKLLVYSTDSRYHYAGDGKLGGIIKPNDEKCHLDHKGSYTMSEEQDYPSLNQISRNVYKHNVHVIFAVTSDQVPSYEALSRLFAGSSTGKLKNDSSNIVELVKQQYDEITSYVKILDDAGDAIKVSYFSKCFGDKLEETNLCTGLRVGTNVTFEVNVEFNMCPSNRSLWNRTFNIYPVGLNEKLTVHLEMLCECDCEKPWNKEPATDECSGGNGTLQCGICNCYNQRFGKDCECDVTDKDPFALVPECYNDDDETPCSGVGTCQCKRCDCSSHPEFYGKYCQCSDLSCDKKDGKLCNGPDHGVCNCGKCTCVRGWKGPDCGCRDTTETCIGKDGKICGGRGKCECGACVCDNSEQTYFGKFCEDCSSCLGMCKELQGCVECWLMEQGQIKNVDYNCTTCAVTILPMNTSEVKGEEKLCTFDDTEGCRRSFKYMFADGDSPLVFARSLKECPTPVDVVAIVSGVTGSIVGAGLLLLCLWKLLTTAHDRRELAKFEKERLKAKWQKENNPLYVEATTTYQNPAYHPD